MSFECVNILQCIQFRVGLDYLQRVQFVQPLLHNTISVSPTIYVFLIFYLYTVIMNHESKLLTVDNFVFMYINVNSNLEYTFLQFVNLLSLSVPWNNNKQKWVALHFSVELAFFAKRLMQVFIYESLVTSEFCVATA